MLSGSLAEDPVNIQAADIDLYTLEKILKQTDMELLSYPKTDYLLDATLESLHAESVEWLNELAFWGDEMSFFYRLLHHKRFSKSFPTSEIAEIEKALVKLNVEELDKMKTDVASHERLLSSVYKSATLSDDRGYREAHRKLLRDMHALQEDIRKFKKSVFSFVEKQVR